ncbi:hypothetical protein PENSUB_8737 [Penicillium subrubescens]|uniref:Uncharacterized protein n=1 Tax=Penicillium subrubescens TaxID=1316194 RepID=A0A1Q5TF19_9EURO|nr:hypothetical protein PENSUB_8737 [Penicillium subrubescens]
MEALPLAGPFKFTCLPRALADPNSTATAVRYIAGIGNLMQHCLFYQPSPQWQVG